jgi:hypothetical protein
MITEFDIQARQAQSLCTTVTAMGELLYVNVTVHFTNGDGTTQLANEMIVAIAHDDTGTCLHIGPGLGNCANTMPWPASFQKVEDGLYTVLLDVQEFNFKVYEGMNYGICVGNADNLSEDTMAYSGFRGELGLYGLTREIESTIKIVSDIAETPLLAEFDMRLRQGQSLCQSFFAMGDLEYVNVTVDFFNGDDTRLSDEFVILLYHLESGDCIQFGPGLSTCKYLDAWPQSFHSSDSGLYTILLDVQEFEFAFYDGMEFSICIGNGDRITDERFAYSRFEGEIGLFGLTSEIKSEIVLTSEVGQNPLAATFDLRFRLGQRLCTNVFAMGTLEYVNMTVDFENGDTTRLSDELLFVLYHIESGDCIQFGPGLSSCKYLEAWPRAFQTTVSGLYTTLIDVRQYIFNFKEGMEYTMCFANGDRVTDDAMAYSTFKGDVSLFGFTEEIESTVEISSNLNEVFSVDFSLRARQGQSLCTSGFVWGNMTSVAVNLQFTNGDFSTLSSKFILALYHVESATCLQFGPGLELCDVHVNWPNNFNQVATGAYTALIDVQAFEAFHSNTTESAEYMVCLGNHELVSANPSAYSQYVGDVSFNGMETRSQYAPTPAPIKASSDDDGAVNMHALYISIGILSGLLFIVVIGYAARQPARGGETVETVNIGGANEKEKEGAEEDGATVNPLNKTADPSDNL